MKEIQLTQGQVAIVDDEDFERLNQWKWFAKKSNSGFYAARNYPINLKKSITLRMHRAIIGITDSSIHVDHINGNGLDNRRINIRSCTHQQNMMNRGTSKRNKTGATGVRVRKNRYEAQIMVAKDYIYLGRYKAIEDAKAARLEAERKYFGEFARAV